MLNREVLRRIASEGCSAPHRCFSTTVKSAPFLSPEIDLAPPISSAPENQYKLKDEDYTRFLNVISRKRKSSLIRKMTDLQNNAAPGTISLAGGFPNPLLFPFKDAVLRLQAGGGKLVLNQEMFQHAQQYGPTTGYPPLVEQVRSLVHQYHQPPNWSETQVVVTAGSQDGFSRSLEMVLTAGDYVIVEEPSFCGALAVMHPHGVKFLGVKADAFGMRPESLAEALSSRWTPEEVREASTGVPKVMYVNPSATNPTGVSLITERKEAIYRIAREYNLLILEDDPYYFIQFQEPENFPKSFLSLDTDGRVLRFDSFSKLLCSGFRVGFLSGPKPLVAKVVQHSEVTILHAPSVSQVIISELLKKWSTTDFESHMARVRSFYRAQREAMNKAALKHLAGLCEWNIPTGGMFLWVKVLSLRDTTQMVLERAPRKDLLLMPGKTFMPGERATSPHLRLSFSYSDPQTMDEGCRRLAELIREEIEMVRSVGGGGGEEGEKE